MLRAVVALWFVAELSGQDATGLPSLERPWDWPVLYSNPDSTSLQEIALQGRFQMQWADATAGDINYGSANAPDFTTWDDLEVRRWRLGARLRFLKEFTLDGHINLRPDLDPAYLATYDLQLTWSRDPSFALVLGKTKVPYTQEYAISSARIATFERSLLVNQVITTPLTGATAFGQIDHWRYRCGIYANDPQPLGEFSRLNAGVAFVGKLAHDFGPALGLRRAWLGIDMFLHSEPPTNGQPAYTRSATLTAECEHGRFGWLSDVLWSGGKGIDNLGLTLLPTWRIAADWQIAFRYHVAFSRGGDGLAPPIRYDRF